MLIYLFSEYLLNVFVPITILKREEAVVTIDMIGPTLEKWVR